MRYRFGESDMESVNRREKSGESDIESDTTEKYVPAPNSAEEVLAHLLGAVGALLDEAKKIAQDVSTQPITREQAKLMGSAIQWFQSHIDHPTIKETVGYELWSNLFSWIVDYESSLDTFRSMRDKDADPERIDAAIAQLETEYHAVEFIHQFVGNTYRDPDEESKLNKPVSEILKETLQSYEALLSRRKQNG